MMTESVFLEIILSTQEVSKDTRYELEDSLDEALHLAGVGEVTGAGSGLGIFNIDVEVIDLQKGLEIIRKVLREQGCPSSTEINQYSPARIIHRVEEAP